MGHGGQALHAAELASEASRQRARLEGELHDGAQQLVVALSRELRALRKALGDAAPTNLERAEALAAELDAELLRVRAGLMPPLLHHEGLAGALPALVATLGQRHGLASCELADGPRLPPPLEEALYWVVQEAMNNAATHSQATHVAVRLDREGDRGLLEVADDGQGCLLPDLTATPASQTGTGLHRHWLALRAVGGELAIDTAPGRGFRLRAHVPLPATPS